MKKLLKFFAALTFLICILIIAFQQKTIIVLTHQNHIAKWLHDLDSISMCDSIKDSCNRCGNIQVLHLYRFNDDTIAKQKQIKKDKDERFGHSKKSI